MLSDLYQHLTWLPRAPKDFGEAIKSLANAGQPEWGAAVKRLAGYGLNEPQLMRLSRAIQTRRSAGLPIGPLIPYRLGLVGNGTLDLLVAPLVGTLARYGFALEVVCAEYDQYLASALDSGSRVNAARPDSVLIALDWRGLGLRPSLDNPVAAAECVNAAVGMIDSLRRGFASGCGAPCLISTIAPPPETLAGALDRAAPGTLRNMCEKVNIAIAERTVAGADCLLDVAALAETVGLANWFDPTLWNTAKAPFPSEFAPLWADHVGRLVAGMKGKSRRALILDLDNTLWGGVIGDDGLEGILIGQGEPTAEAHLDVQKMALALRTRGVVLAVSSKNFDEVARRPFTDHPDMLLKLDHIAVFQANWTEKASNIKSISEELALGLESFVFLDDNPAERALVRATLPDVAVPELADDPALYARTLAAAGYFELPVLSPEDIARADMYRTNAKRTSLKSQVADMDAYLKSLDMEMIASPFDSIGRARVAQLINKSNQFNLTTRRYDEPELQDLETDPSVFTMQIRLTDTFGDNGMICVIICRTAEPQVWEIDTWLMSCRVLGRGVERTVLREILAHARWAGVSQITGRYSPTGRNSMVAEHYGGLGFKATGRLHDGETLWSLNVATEIPASPMKVKRFGFAKSAENGSSRI